MPQKIKTSKEIRKIEEIISILSLLEKNNLNHRELFAKAKLSKPAFLLKLQLLQNIGYVKNVGRTGRTVFRITDLGMKALEKLKEKVKCKND